MNDEWLSWQPNLDQLGTDEEGIDQLLRACGCHNFDDMFYGDMSSSGPVSMGITDLQTSTTLQHNENKPSPVSVASTDGDILSSDTNTPTESTIYGDQIIPHSNTSDQSHDLASSTPSHEGDVFEYLDDTTVDGLLDIYDGEGTTLSGGDDGGQDAYPTPATTPWTLCEPEAIELGR